MKNFKKTISLILAICMIASLAISASAANRNRFALVDMFAGIVADELDLLGIVVDRLVYDHDIALSLAVLEVRRGVHADVDHALGYFLIQLLRDFFGRKVVPTALDSAGIVDDTCFGAGFFLGQRFADQTGDKKDARAYGTDEKCNGKHNTDVALGLLGMILICFVHRNSSFVF